MYISDILKNNKVTVSFEVFPPKEWAKLVDTKAVIGEMVKDKPAFMSVTYGAAGTTSGYTTEIANAVAQGGVTPLAHLTCLTSTKEKINSVLDELEENNIKNILALRGDIPKDFEVSEDLYYHHAFELVKEIKARGKFCVGGACYPEIHPESRNRVEDIAHLKEKVDCGLDFLTTQMFFDNEKLYSFREMCAIKEINVPIIAGIMPITNANQIKRSIELSNCSVPKKFLRIMERFGENPDAMKQAGIIYATDQIIDLMANGVNNIHIYTMNKPDVAHKIMEGLSEIINEQR
ncbi:MAG: methylenetetrahydrofolate reductase [NAD(P)H] [Eubacterium sp.]